MITYTCCGIFSSRAKALEGKLKLVHKKKLKDRDLDIDEYKMLDNIERLVFNVYHIDFYEHGAIYTHIVGIEGQQTPWYEKSNTYTIPYEIDRLKLDLFE